MRALSAGGVLVLFCIAGYAVADDKASRKLGKTSNFVDELYASIQEAKKAKDILSGITTVEIAEKIIGHFIPNKLITKPVKGVDKELQALAKEVSGTHVASFLLDHNLTAEEAIELAVLFDKIPLYAKIHSTRAGIRGVDATMDVFDEMHYHGAHEGIGVEHKYYLSDEQFDYLIGQSPKFRVHWYRAREILKLSMWRKLGR